MIILSYGTDTGINMNLTGALRSKNQIILSVCDWAEKECEHIHRSGAIDVEGIGKAIDFFSHFVDRGLGVKEEDILLAALKAQGFFDSRGPIAIIVAERESRGMQITAAAGLLPRAAAGDSQARQLLQDRLREYIGGLRRHIAEAEAILYPVVAERFSEEEQRRLLAEFTAVQDKLGREFHDRYLRLAAELSSR